MDVIVRLVTFEQFWNACVPIVVIPLGIVNDENPEQPENAPAPIVFIELGEEKVKLLNPLQPKNEFALISVIPEPIVNLQLKPLSP